MKLQYILALLLTAFLAAQASCQSNEDGGIKKIKALMIDGKYRNAIDELNSIILKDSADTEALYYLGLNYQALSDFYKAASVLQKAVEYKPYDTRLLYSLGDNYFSSGLINQADTVLSKAFSLDSTGNEVQILLGKVLMNKQKWNKAASIYLKLIDEDSSNSYFYEKEAKCQSELDNIEPAITYYSRANLLNPKNINTSLELSYLLYLQKQYDTAIKVVNDGLKYYRFKPSLYKRKADIYMKMEDYAGAVSNYYFAFANGDSSAENLKNIGISLYWEGQKDNTLDELQSAVNFLEHSAEKNNKDAVTFFYLGALYKNFKEYKKSLDNFMHASDLLKDSFLENTYVQIGAVYQLENKYKDALDYYQDALRENPSDKSTLFYIGNSYDKLKQKRMAVYYFKKFIKEDPNGDKKLLGFASGRLEALK